MTGQAPFFFFTTQGKLLGDGVAGLHGLRRGIHSQGRCHLDVMPMAAGSTEEGPPWMREFAEKDEM